MTWRKSLFSNILRVSPSSSRFCGSPAQPPSRKPLRINILALSGRKDDGAAMLLSPMFPIFCPQNIEFIGVLGDFPPTVFIYLPHLCKLCHHCSMPKPPKKPPKWFWEALAWGGILSAAYALLAASSLSKTQLVVIAVFGLILSCITTQRHGWFKAQSFPIIGTIIRVPLVLILISGVWALLLWMAWPIGLDVYPATFTFINPPMPTETFTITVSNRSDQSIYLVQFSLKVDDNNSGPSDFVFGIPRGSIRILGQSKDGIRSMADIMLIPCQDEDEHLLFLFFIPKLDAKESRDVTITSIKHSTATGSAKPVYYDEKPHSVSWDDNGDTGFDLRLSSKSNARNCQAPWLFFMDTGNYQSGHFQKPSK